MAYTGHFDFGANLRPIDFGGWLDDADGDNDGAAADSQTPNFWLRYWCTAYAHILANRGDGVALLDYDGCCANPGVGLRQIAAAIGLPNPTPLTDQAARFRPPTRYDSDTPQMNPQLLRQADDIHRQLLQNAINRPA